MVNDDLYLSESWSCEMTDVEDSMLFSDFDPFWNSIRSSSLSFPKCNNCNRFHWYPKKLCPFCKSTNIHWTPIKGEGSIFSWTIVRHAFSDDYKDKIPYVIVLIEFDDAPGVRLVSNLTSDNLECIHFGMKVKPIYSLSENNHPLVIFDTKV